MIPLYTTTTHGPVHVVEIGGWWLARSRTMDDKIDVGSIETDELKRWLRYQRNVPPYTTMAECDQQCGGWARGGGVCAKCIEAELERRGER